VYEALSYYCIHTGEPGRVTARLGAQALNPKP